MKKLLKQKELFKMMGVISKGIPPTKFVPILILIVIIISLLPMLRRVDYISSNPDALYNFFYFGFIKKSFIEYHQFPLRNPYAGGGYPFFADPRDHSLNPLVVVSVVIAGEVVGAKIYILIMYFIGALGMYYLTYYVLRGYTRIGALCSALVFVLSGWMVSRVLDGNFDEMHYFYFPLLLGFLIKATKDRRYVIYLALLLALIVFDGKLYYPCSLLFLFLFAFLYGIKFKNKKIVFNFNYIKALLTATIFSVLLGMIKIWPMYNRILQFTQRRIDVYADVHSKLVTMKKVLYYLVNHAQFFQCFQTSWLYVGYLSLVLCIVAFIVYWKESSRWLIVLIIALFLTLGSLAPVDLFKILWHLPLFHSIEQPWKYFGFFIIFGIALGTGKSFSLAAKLLDRSSRVLVSLLLLLCVTVPLIRYNMNIYKNAFNRRYVSRARQRQYFQIKGQGIDRKDHSQLRRIEYFNMLQNVGTIDWHTPLPLAENTIPKYYLFPDNSFKRNPEYRGEVFFDNFKKNSARILRFTPNNIRIRVKITEPDDLIINQNYDSSWYVNIGQVKNKNGLLTVALDKVGEYVIELKYIPIDFYLGMLITLVSLIGTILLLRKFRCAAGVGG